MNNEEMNNEKINRLKEEIRMYNISLYNLKREKNNIQKKIIEKQENLYKLCPHEEYKVIHNYYDKTTKECTKCGYEY